LSGSCFKVLFEVLYSNTNPNAKREKNYLVKAPFYLLLSLLIQACASMTPSPAPVDHGDAPLWLQQAFPAAQIAAVTYYAPPQNEAEEQKLLKGAELVFEETPDAAVLRQDIQNTLIDYLTQHNHPEGNCVQVEHTLRAKKDIFKVLVVCVG
jgi:hypothetical protein